MLKTIEEPLRQIASFTDSEPIVLNKEFFTRLALGQLDSSNFSELSGVLGKIAGFIGTFLIAFFRFRSSPFSF